MLIGNLKLTGLQSDNHIYNYYFLNNDFIRLVSENLLASFLKLANKACFLKIIICYYLLYI